MYKGSTDRRETMGASSVVSIVAASKVAQTEKFMPPLQRSRYPRR